MAFRGAATSVGRQSTASLFPVPRYLRSTCQHVSAPPSALHRSTTHFPRSQPGTMRFPIRAMNGTAPEPQVPTTETEDNWEIKMLYDGECPLCMKEVNMLRERNERYRTIKFVDISSDKYNPEDNQGLDYKAAMGRIHAIQSDGTVVRDVEAFRRLYEVVGLGWVYAITKYEPVASIASAVYGVWAKYRLQITGRPPLEKVLEERSKKKEACGDNKACKM